MATLTGNARTILNAPAGAIPYAIQPISRQVIVSGRLIFWSRKAGFTAYDGSFSMTLAAGEYEVTFNGTDKFQISVPNDDGTYPFIDRITSTVTQPSPAPGGSSWPTFPAGSDVIITSTGQLIFKSRSSGLYHKAFVTGPADEPQLVIEAGTETP